MPKAKKRPKKGTASLVIGSPKDFKRETEAAELLLEAGVPTLRGGYDNGTASRSDPPDADKASVLSLIAFARESRLPSRTSSLAPPPLAHRHTAPPKVSLPNPLRANPPKPLASPETTPVAELEGSSPPLSTHNARNRGSSTAGTSKSNRHSVIYGGFEAGSPFFPIIEQVEDMPFPLSESSASSGQASPVAEPKGQRTPNPAKKKRSSCLPAIGPLPLEMREPLRIWQKYMRTGVIDVDVCPEALDGEGNYTWMHCWGLFNLYTFGASFMNDTEFADRVMDMMCRSIKSGQAADFDTICLIFTGENVSSRLKQLVVDRCVDGGLKGLRRGVTKNLPHEFAAVALEAAMERLADEGWRHRLESPCRYHRHKRAEDCHLRKFADARDRCIIENRKNRKSRNSTQVRFELDAIECTQSAVGGTKVDHLDRNMGTVPEPSVEQNVVDIEKHSDRSDTTNSESVSIASVKEAELDTGESSVIAALGLEDSSVSTAKTCEIFKPAAQVSLVDVTCTLPEMGRNSSQCSETSQEGTHKSTVLDEWPRLSLVSTSEELLLPGAYPESLLAVGRF
jgi:hypothetical protein